MYWRKSDCDACWSDCQDSKRQKGYAFAQQDKRVLCGVGRPIIPESLTPSACHPKPATQHQAVYHDQGLLCLSTDELNRG